MLRNETSPHRTNWTLCSHLLLFIWFTKIQHPSHTHTHTHIRQENDVESIIVIRLVSLYYQKYFYCFCDVNSVGLPHSPFSALSLWSIEIPSSFLYFLMSFSLGISDICGKPSLFLENRFERYDLLSSGMDDRYETTWKYAKLIG